MTLNLKKGIVLIATLQLVFAIMALLAVSLGFLQNGLDDSRQFQKYNQTSIILKDLKKAIPEILQDIKSPADFEKITFIPMKFEQKEDGILFEITFRPNYTLDINRLNDMAVRDVFSKILKKHKIKNEELFFDMLANRDKLAQLDKRFKKTSFDSLEQWNMFVQLYAQDASDPEAININWSELVGFDSLLFDPLATEGNLSLDGIEIPQNLKVAYDASSYQFVVEVAYELDGLKDKFSFLYSKNGGQVSNLKHNRMINVRIFPAYNWININKETISYEKLTIQDKKRSILILKSSVLI